MGWPDIEPNLANVKLKSEGYKWMHNRLIDIDQRKLTFWTYLGMLISPASGLTIILNSNDSLYVRIIIGIIAAVPAAIMGFLQFRDYPAEIYESKQYNSRYSTLVQMIDYQLILGEAQRENSDTFLQRIMATYNSITSFDDKIPRAIVKEYIALHRDFGSEKMPETTRIISDSKILRQMNPDIMTSVASAVASAIAPRSPPESRDQSALAAFELARLGTA